MYHDLVCVFLSEMLFFLFLFICLPTCVFALRRTVTIGGLSVAIPVGVSISEGGIILRGSGVGVSTAALSRMFLTECTRDGWFNPLGSCTYTLVHTH